MDSIFEKITQAINEFLISLIEGSLGTMFNDVKKLAEERLFSSLGMK